MTRTMFCDVVGAQVPACANNESIGRRALRVRIATERRPLARFAIRPNGAAALFHNAVTSG